MRQSNDIKKCGEFAKTTEYLDFGMFSKTFIFMSILLLLDEK